MKITICLWMLLLIVIYVSAQRNKQISLAFINAGTSKPFSQFGNLVSDIHQPGIELGYAFNWKTKHKHDWFQEIKLSYFYHRFVQHAIPLYTDFGYRYKFSKRWSAQAAIGAGYMHSLPATAQLTLQSNGEYKNGKGIGRMQALGVLNVGTSYTLNPSANKFAKIFITWQQMLQMPFINAYVPLLPYNSLLLGVSLPLKSTNK